MQNTPTEPTLSNPSGAGTQTPASPEPSMPAMPDTSKPKGRWMLMTGLVLVVAVVGVVGWYVTQKSSNTASVRTFKIGVDSQFTGEEEPIKRGVELAQRHFADDKISVTVVPVSTECEGEKAVKAAKDWAAQGVVAVIGDVCSSAMLDAADTITQLKLPHISASATNAQVSEASDYIFRTIPSDAFAADFTSKYLYDTVKARKLAVFYGEGDYGEGLKADVTSSFEKRGGKVVTTQSFEDEATDIKKQVAQVEAAKPDSIYIATTSTSTALLILQQLKADGVKVPVLGSETLKDLTNFEEFSAAEGVTVVGANNGTAKYLADFKAAYGQEPGTYSAQAYDAYAAIFKTLQAGADSGEEIKNALYGVSFSGASGPIAFNKDGDIASNYTVYKMINGAFKAQQ